MENLLSILHVTIRLFRNQISSCQESSENYLGNENSQGYDE